MGSFSHPNCTIECKIHRFLFLRTVHIPTAVLQIKPTVRIPNTPLIFTTFIWYTVIHISCLVLTGNFSTEEKNELSETQQNPGCTVESVFSKKLDIGQVDETNIQQDDTVKKERWVFDLFKIVIS